MYAESDFSFGETLSILESLVVSPAWGRLHPEPLEAGQVVEEGTVIGRVLEGTTEIPLICHVQAVFLAWLAQEGERVSPGRRVARLALAPA